jgi:hypothetical protein
MFKIKTNTICIGEYMIKFMALIIGVDYIISYILYDKTFTNNPKTKWLQTKKRTAQYLRRN